MHVMEEFAVATMALKIMEQALPEITKRAEQVEEGKPLTFREVWPDIEAVGQSIADSKFGDVAVIHGRAHT